MDIKPIQKLLVLCDADTKEISRLEAMISELAAEDARMLATLDINDHAQFSTLSNIRLKKELAQAKIPQLQTRLLSTRKQLSQALDKIIHEFNLAIFAKMEEFTQKLAKAMQPAITDPSEASDWAHKIVNQANGPVRNLSLLIMDPASDRDQILQAEEFLNRCQLFEKGV
jgi:hypothetical protein